MEQKYTNLETVNVKLLKDTRYKLDLWIFCCSVVILFAIYAAESYMIDITQYPIKYKCQNGHFDCAKNRKTCNDLSCNYCIFKPEYRATECRSPMSVWHESPKTVTEYWFNTVKIVISIIGITAFIGILSNNTDENDYIDISNGKLISFKTGRDFPDDIKLEMKKILSTELRKSASSGGKWTSILVFISLIKLTLFLVTLSLSFINLFEKRCPENYVDCYQNLNCEPQNCKGCLTFQNEVFKCMEAKQLFESAPVWYALLFNLMIIGVYLLNCVLIIKKNDFKKKYKEFYEVTGLADEFKNDAEICIRNIDY